MADETNPRSLQNMNSADICRQNDRVFTAARAQAKTLHCPVMPESGGHEPLPHRTQNEENTIHTHVTGWSFVQFTLDSGSFNHFGYFCQKCHLMFYVKI